MAVFEITRSGNYETHRDKFGGWWLHRVFPDRYELVAANRGSDFSQYQENPQAEISQLRERLKYYDAVVYMPDLMEMTRQRVGLPNGDEVIPIDPMRVREILNENSKLRDEVQRLRHKILLAQSGA